MLIETEHFLADDETIMAIGFDVDWPDRQIGIPLQATVFLFLRMTPNFICLPQLEARIIAAKWKACAAEREEIERQYEKERKERMTNRKTSGRII